MDAGNILDAVTLGGLPVVTLVVVWLGARAKDALRLAIAGLDQAVRDQAAEIVAERNRYAVLNRELERVRGTERQELRFQSYGELWATMRPLAIYDDQPINRESMRKLAIALSDWYFKPTGGLMLTKQSRDLYFTLQDLLRTTGHTDSPWSAERVIKPEDAFEALLTQEEKRGALQLRALLRDARAQDWPPDELGALTKGWKKEINELAGIWDELDEQTRFAVLQQVSSALRTGLTLDVESRLR